jgi:hypothetical protein
VVVRGEYAAEVGDGGCGEGVAVGVDADDAIDELCQHGHAVVLLVWGAAVVGVGLGGVTARHDCDGSQPCGLDRLLIRPAWWARPTPAPRQTAQT